MKSNRELFLAQCLIWAAKDSAFDGTNLLKLASEYGVGVQPTSKELESLLTKPLREIIATAEANRNLRFSQSQQSER
jgi:hypothetical protein